ncbi:MAG: hypothetical protein LBG10_07840 [Treponema sp.]|jgi:hypothetical protein|nr:hypothetical protein [Treponema sp.]
MKRRELVVCWVFFLFPSFLSGEDRNLFPLPLVPLLELVAAGEPAWRPDWPGDFPPDAFSLRGQALSITLDSGAGPITLSRDLEGRLREFPFFFNGAFMQVKAAYGPSGALRNLSVESPETAWGFDFPPESFSEGIVPGTGPIRVNRDGTWYTVLFLEAGSVFSETWYDEAGNFLAYYTAHILRDGPRWRIRSLEFHSQDEPVREDYDFDNADRITGVSSPLGNFTALYRFGRPRYWERRPVPDAGLPPNVEPPPDAGSPAPAAPDSPGSTGPVEEGAGNFVLQWDEEGFLVEKRAAPGETGGEFRYEYEIDRQGNWIIRREMEMMDRAGVRVPIFRREAARHIVYQEK